MNTLKKAQHCPYLCVVLKVGIGSHSSLRLSLHLTVSCDNHFRLCTESVHSESWVCGQDIVRRGPPGPRQTKTSIWTFVYCVGWGIWEENSVLLVSGKCIVKRISGLDE